MPATGGGIAGQRIRLHGARAGLGDVPTAGIQRQRARGRQRGGGQRQACPLQRDCAAGQRGGCGRGGTETQGHAGICVEQHRAAGCLQRDHAGLDPEAVVDVDAARTCRHRQSVGAKVERVGAACGVGEIDEVGGRERDVGVLCLQRRRRDCAVAGTGGHAAVGDVEVGGIDQQRAAAAAACQAGRRRGRIDEAGEPDGGAGNLDAAAIAGQRTAARGDRAAERRGAGREQRDVSAIAVMACIGRQPRAMCHTDAARNLSRPHVWAAERARGRGADGDDAAAGIARGIDSRGGRDGDRTGRVGHHLAAFGARCHARGGDRAVDLHRAADACHQDAPCGSTHAVGLQRAAGGDQRAHQAVRGLRGERDGAAISQDYALVRDERGHSAAAERYLSDQAGNIERQQAVAIQIECVGGGTAQDHPAEPCLDEPVIGHLRRHKGGEPGLAYGERAVIGDARARMGSLVEHQMPGHEVLRGDAWCGDDEARGIDLRSLIEHHAGLVDDNELAVGVDVPGDFRRIGADDGVQRHRVAVRLHEIDALLAADVEALPVDGGALAGLGNGGGAGTLANAGAAADDHAACGVRARCELGESRVCEGAQGGGAGQQGRPSFLKKRSKKRLLRCRVPFR